MKLRPLLATLAFTASFATFATTLSAATRSVPSQYATVQAAVNAAASGDTIAIANGTYTEQVTIPSGKNSLKLVGASQTGVIITAGLNQKAMVVNGNDTTFSYLTLRNTAGLTAGNTSQAVMVYGSRTEFYRCYLNGSQDTIYLGGGPNYFAWSEIRGSVDFIYGGSASYFTTCNIRQVRPTGGPATAPNTPQTQTYGFVFINCTINSASGVAAGSSTLMRPWGPYGQSVFINCTMDASISAAGWSAWSGREATCRAYEYGSKNPTAPSSTSPPAPPGSSASPPPRPPPTPATTSSADGSPRSSDNPTVFKKSSPSVRAVSPCSRLPRQAGLPGRTRVPRFGFGVPPSPDRTPSTVANGARKFSQTVLLFCVLCVLLWPFILTPWQKQKPSPLNSNSFSCYPSSIGF